MSTNTKDTNVETYKNEDDLDLADDAGSLDLSFLDEEGGDDEKSK